jgi:hypothetical protein
VRGTPAALSVIVQFTWFLAAAAVVAPAVASVVAPAVAPGVASVIAPGVARADDCERVALWRAGRPESIVCRDQAVARGLTILDLGDDWVPPVLDAPADGKAPAYRATYLALAQERFSEAGSDGAPAARDRYLELYGVAPTLGVIRSRLADAARHRCHAQIDDLALAAAPFQLGEEQPAQGLARLAAARAIRAELERERDRRKLADLEALAEARPGTRRAVDRLTLLEGQIAAVRAVQAHLACDGLFPSRPVDAAYTWQTTSAVAAFQRGVMVLPTARLDTQTLDALAVDSRERDYRAALRVLRERVVAATGLIEDGTAGDGPRPVLDRALEPEATWRVRGHDPLADAAPDLIAPATEAAARALGWLDADTTQRALEQLAASEARTRLVAVALPPPPAYHRPVMELSIEIDRGDVWHDATPHWRDAPRRPALIIYTMDGDRRIPLARWPTTIGGWQDQQIGDEIEPAWKESPVGPRVWRDLFVAPTWLPPISTPDRELLRSSDGGAALAREQLGPSYRAAFGMIAFVHLVEDVERGQRVLEDQGIRTHGTGNLTSLANGVSHGCHRVLGRNIVRLADFVLAHRYVERRGELPTYYRRVVHHGGRGLLIAIDSLGYAFELVPAISVEVLPGRVHR